jgi:hypothetical protein
MINVNVAEAMLDHFFDPDISSLPLYQCEKMNGSKASVSQGWCYVQIDVPNGTRGDQLRLVRNCDYDATDYDRFTLRASYSETVSISVYLNIDQERQDDYVGIMSLILLLISSTSLKS